MSVDYSDEATRMAIVNPMTGTEIPIDQNDQDFDPDATIIGGKMTTDQSPSLAPTEEYICVDQLIDAQEQTALWSNAPTAQERLHQLRRAIGNRKRPLAVLLAVGILLGTVPLLHALLKPKPVNHAPAKSASISPPSPTEATPVAIKNPSLAKAINLLEQGQLQQARQMYQALAKVHPDNRSYRLSTTILETRETTP